MNKKRIMHIVVLSCKKATELIEKQSLIRLSVIENFQLKLHKSICDACTRYEKQSKFLDNTLKQHISSENKPLKNDELKEKLIQNLLK